jgi:hypothetical protein
MRRKKVSKDKEVRKHENINKRFTYIYKKGNMYIYYIKKRRGETMHLQEGGENIIFLIVGVWF